MARAFAPFDQRSSSFFFRVNVARKFALLLGTPAKRGCRRHSQGP
jgi:hypothetical protein